MSNQAFRVQGNANLSGSIQPQGAKNEALQIISAVLLTDKKVTIKNIPNILDINKQMELLTGLGVKIEKLSDNDYTFQADDIDTEHLSSKEYQENAKKNPWLSHVVGSDARSLQEGISSQTRWRQDRP